MWLTSIRLGLSIALVMCVCAAVQAGSIPKTRAPFIYLIDYSMRYLDDEQEILAFKECPPDLMHVGKSVPILHNWGPVPLISGENQ